jgi:excisionase family DNA binding protein
MDTLTAPSSESQANVSKRFYSVSEVGEIMGVPASTVYDLARQRRISGMVRFGRHIRFDKTKFEAWLDAGGETAREAA